MHGQMNFAVARARQDDLRRAAAATLARHDGDPSAGGRDRHRRLATKLSAAFSRLLGAARGSGDALVATPPEARGERRA